MLSSGLRSDVANRLNYLVVPNKLYYFNFPYQRGELQLAVFSFIRKGQEPLRFLPLTYDRINMKMELSDYTINTNRPL